MAIEFIYSGHHLYNYICLSIQLNIHKHHLQFVAINHLQTYFCLWLGTKISFLIYSLFVPNWSQSRKNIFQCYATLWILIFMEQNTLLHSSQLSIAVINITLYYNDYGPAYTDTVCWLSVATNTMTHRLRTSDSKFFYGKILAEKIFFLQLYFI